MDTFDFKDFDEIMRRERRLQEKPFAYSIKTKSSSSNGAIVFYHLDDKERKLALSKCPLHNCSVFSHQLSYFNIHYYTLTIMCPQLVSTYILNYQEIEHIEEKVDQIIQKAADFIFTWNKIKEYI